VVLVHVHCSLYLLLELIAGQAEDGVGLADTRSKIGLQTRKVDANSSSRLALSLSLLQQILNLGSGLEYVPLFEEDVHFLDVGEERVASCLTRRNQFHVFLGHVLALHSVKDEVVQSCKGIVGLTHKFLRRGEDRAQVALVVLVEGGLEEVLARLLVAVLDLKLELGLDINLRLKVDDGIKEAFGGEVLGIHHH